MTTIFEDTTMTKHEYGVHSSISAARHPDGSVGIKVDHWTDDTDKTAIPYVLSAEDAERLGRTLLCMDNSTFDGLMYRAQEMLQ